VNSNMYFAFLAVSVSMALGRFLTERSRRTLSSEQKLEIMEILEPLRKYWLVYMVAFVFFIYKRSLPWLIWGFAVTIFAAYAAKWILIRRVKALQAYFTGNTIETCIALTGTLAFLLMATLMPPGI
jgi:hypothetical protein